MSGMGHAGRKCGRGSWSRARHGFVSPGGSLGDVRDQCDRFAGAVPRWSRPAASGRGGRVLRKLHHLQHWVAGLANAAATLAGEGAGLALAAHCEGTR